MLLTTHRAISIKIRLLLFFSFSGFHSNAQTGETVLLRWKIAPGDSVVYNTVMKSIDTGIAQGLYFNLQKLVPDFFKDSSSKKSMKKETEIAADFAKSFDSLGYRSILKRNKPDFLDVRMEYVKPKNDLSIENDPSTPAQLRSLMQSMSAGVALRGTIANDGSVRSNREL